MVYLEDVIQKKELREKEAERTSCQEVTDVNKVGCSYYSCYAILFRYESKNHLSFFDWCDLHV